MKKEIKLEQCLEILQKAVEDEFSGCDKDLYGGGKS